MRQAFLLTGSFIGTLAVLLAAYLVWTGVGSGRASPSPSAVASVGSPAAAPAASQASSSPAVAPSPRPTPTPAAIPSPTASPTPAAILTPQPRLTPGPVATPSPSAPASPAGSATVFAVTLAGRDYDTGSVAMVDNASITPLAGGGIVLTTDRSSHGELLVAWLVPATRLPPGAVILRIDVAICGSGSGDFWEVYGPPGSAEAEYEGTPPGPDRCWHFSAAPGPDTTIKAGVELGSRLQIDRIFYRFTLR